MTARILSMTTFALLAFARIATAQIEFGEEIIITEASDWAYAVYAADLDGDDDHDVIVGSIMDNKIVWFANEGVIGFGTERIVPQTAPHPESVIAADLDGDGDQDIIGAMSGDWYSNSAGATVSWNENTDGAGTFSDQASITDSAIGVNSVFAGDFDGDQDLDVLSASAVDDKIGFYRNDGTGAFGPQILLSDSADFARHVTAADIDGDGDLDAVSSAMLDDEVAWYENDGAGNFGAPRTITDSAMDVRMAAFADIDGDGDPDAVVASFSDDKITWHENDGAGNFDTTHVVTDTADGAMWVVAEDFDGDGAVDLVYCSENDDKVGYYHNDGTGAFDYHVLITNASDGPQALYAADMDGDGDLDVIVASKEDDKVAMYKNLADYVSAEQRSDAPTAFALEHSFPNPFNPTTTIRYTLPEAATIRLTVYNALGEEIATLVDGARNAGVHSATFNAANLAGGAYFYRIDALGVSGERFQETRKTLLVK
ncbi:MAG: T9SS type A sorting domain-containing protein [Ignavibacteriales bacterium]|nr:T9SS type A sorting domain-containing protein [Ignavibacteriales bacterium]